MLKNLLWFNLFGLYEFGIILDGYTTKKIIFAILNMEFEILNLEFLSIAHKWSLGSTGFDSETELIVSMSSAGPQLVNLMIHLF